MYDRHDGRRDPTYNISANPDSFARIVNTHGLLARVMRARACPCVMVNGSPNWHCNLCHGDGYIYDFQRKLMIGDEDSDIRWDGAVIYPQRIPLIEPIKVQRCLPPEQGGTVTYEILSYTANEIRIAGDPLPRPYEMMRVSYFADRFTHVENEVVNVDAVLRTLSTVGTLFDDGTRSSNFVNIHGDIVIIDRIWNSVSGYEYTDYSFNKQMVYLSATGPDPISGQIRMNYYFAQPERVAAQEIDIRNEKEEKTLANIPQGMLRMMFNSYVDIGEGDHITLLMPTYYKTDIITHRTGVDRIFEFDVASIDDRIFDESGAIYYKNVDYTLKRFREIHWITGGRQPAASVKMSVRYGYHPTFVVFGDMPAPNNLDNRLYPITVMTKLWAKTQTGDPETMPSWNLTHPETHF
jgi:hypothetical protein